MTTHELSERARSIPSEAMALESLRLGQCNRSQKKAGSWRSADMRECRASFAGICAAALAALATSALIGDASAQSIADHFRGKTLKILVPSAPGGDRALYPVVFAPFFSKNLPGNPTVQPVFMPGAGGSTAINYTYGVAAPDR